MESACECGADGVAAAHERGVVTGGDARRDRDAERPAELLGGVDQPGGEPGFVF